MSWASTVVAQRQRQLPGQHGWAEEALVEVLLDQSGRTTVHSSAGLTHRSPRRDQALVAHHLDLTAGEEHDPAQALIDRKGHERRFDRLPVWRHEVHAGDTGDGRLPRLWIGPVEPHLLRARSRAHLRTSGVKTPRQTPAGGPASAENEDRIRCHDLPDVFKEGLTIVTPARVRACGASLP
jgi:hypothetical protein